MPIDKKDVIELHQLSKKNYLVLSFIMWYLIKNHYYPTSTEIDCACLMGGSPSQALKRLNEQGYLIRTGKKRGLIFTDKAYYLLDKNIIDGIWNEWSDVKNDPKRFPAWIKKYKVSKKYLK